MMKKLFLLIILAMVVGFAHSQQQTTYTHYMFNTSAFNPAYVGTRDAISATMTHRSQWVGFEGAPVTQSLIVHSPLVKGLGAGFSLVNDKIGPLNFTSLNVDVAYRLKITRKSRLSFGLKSAINISSADFNALELNDQVQDPTFQNSIQGDVTPNFGAGIYYYNQTFYVGLSTPYLLSSRNETTIASDIAQAQQHYYLMGGAILPINRYIKFRPSAFIKTTKGAPTQFDLTSFFVFYDKIWAGAMYRSGDAVGLLTGYNFSDNLQFGYSFDWSYQILGRNSGSHELMLRYEFNIKPRKRVLSPRFF